MYAAPRHCGDFGENILWAIKLFDDEGEKANLALLKLASDWGAGVEIALYGSVGMGEAVDKALREDFAPLPRHGLGLHLPHGKLCVRDLSMQRWTSGAKEEAFGVQWPSSGALFEAPKEGSLLSAQAMRLAQEAAWARSVGCLEAVIHLDRGNGAEEGWRRSDPEALARECRGAIQAASEMGLRLHMEKTYESREWLMAFYNEINRQGLASHFGFTLDLGHTRVWEREPLELWMEWIAELDGQGFGLHFHLHGNPGDTDRHDTLSHCQSMGWLDPDPEWAPNGALPIVKEIARLYENKALLVLENTTAQARENLGWVELAIR